MSNVTQNRISARVAHAGRSASRFVRISLKPVIVKLSRKLSVTYWPGRRRSISAMLMALLSGFVPGLAAAAPTGGQVVAGSATVLKPSASATQINQASQNAVINWQGFSIGAGESVRFVQPSASAVALNRVIGADPSLIFGSLTANGKVFLVNGAGVYFAPGASVDVGGLVASSMSISDASFLSGKYKFEAGAQAGAVKNLGQLRGAFVVLAAPQVSNGGSIDTAAGTTALAAGGKLTLDIAGDKLVSMNVDAAIANAAVVNSGSISADGGKVFISASSANAVLDTVINTSGIVRAGSLVERNGQVVIDGGNAGTVAVSGTLAASGAGTTGGDVKVTGARLALQAGANIDVSGDTGGGTALIGGDLHGAGGVSTAAFTQVDRGAFINADAGASGNGGKVVVWADQHTGFAGAISAKGGALGGNGGFVETSGKNTLAFAGKVDTRAARGTTGTLLLDPTNITISSGASSGGISEAGGTFTGTAADSTLNVADLTTALGSTSVIVDTASAAPSAGNIVVADAINWNAANNLTLKASGSIAVNAPITSGASGAITLNADGAINAGSLTTTGGNIEIGGAAGGSSRAGSVTGGTIASNGGNVIIRSSGAMSTGGINAGSGTIAVTGNAGIAINGALTTTNGGGSAIVINAGAQGIAGSGSGGDISVSGGSFSTGAGGRTTLYTGSLAGSSGVTAAVGAGSGHFRYNSDASNANFSAALGSGVYAVYREQPTLAVTASSGSITYGAAAPAMTVSYAGLQNGDSSAQALSAEATASVGGGVSGSGHLVAGAHAVTASGAADQLGYAIGYTGGNLAVAAKTLRATGITASNKVYDAGTSATIDASGASIVGGAAAAGDEKFYTGDVVGVAPGSATGTFADKAAGNAKPVAVAGLLTGADAANYTLVTSVSANVTAKDVTVNNITAAGKVYDATNAAVLSTGAAALTGGATGSADGKVYAGDTVTVNAGGATGVFADTHAGTKAVAVTGLALGGADAGNYNVIAPALSATIAKKDLLVSGLTASTKVYDQTTAATLDTASAAIADGAATAVDNKFYTGDSVTLNATGATGSFSGMHAGAHSVTVGGLALTGTNAGDYNLVTSVNGTITAKPLLANNVVAADKTYDATTAATIDASGASISGGAADATDNKFYAGDALTLVTGGASGTFANKNAATGKLVTINGLSLGGASAGDYTVTANASGSILQKDVAFANITANGKVYDATTAATLNLAGATLIAGATTAGDNKVYTGDAVAIDASSGSGVFADAHAGSKTVSVSGLALTGADSANYRLMGGGPVTATITPKDLLVSGIGAANKTYDATVAATLDIAAAAIAGGAATATDNKFYTGDAVALNTAGASAAFASKHAGVAVPVTVSGLTLTGANGGDYHLLTAPVSATIVQKEVAVSGISAADRVYDASVSATIDTSAAAIVGGAADAGDKKFYSGDAVALSAGAASGQFADKMAAPGKAVIISGLSLTGADAGDYKPIADVHAAITPKSLDVANLSVSGKVYDATTVASVDASGAQVTGGAIAASDGKYYTGDAVALAAGAVSGSFDSAQAGTQAVTVQGLSLSGSDAVNYAVASPVLSATISPAHISSVTGVSVADKVYDGNTSAVFNPTGATLVGVMASDASSVVVSDGTANFSDRNVGQAKTVTVSGMALSGAAAGNYVLDDTAVAVAAANITRRPSVTLVGSGDWSVAANWENGAIPDLANVAQVIIPAGQTVTFNSAVPALNGSVQVDAIGGAGALVVGNGTLAVRDALKIGSYAQSSGQVGAGSLDAGSAFAQTGGKLDVAGALNIVQASGAATLGDIRAASLSIAGAGATQAAGSALIVSDTVTLDAGAADVTLGNAGNDLRKVVVASARDVTLADVNSLEVGGKLAGSLRTSSGALALDTTAIGGGLAVKALGAVTQSGPLSVAGATTIDTTGTLSLDNASNDFAGAVGASGASVVLADRNILTLSKITATKADLRGGSELQVAAGGIIDAPAIALSLSPTLTTGAIGSMAHRFQVQPNAKVTLGVDTPAVPAYFGGAGAQVLLTNPAAIIAYLQGSVDMFDELGKLATWTGSGPMSTVAGLYARTQEPDWLQAGSKAAIVERGLYADLTVEVPYPHGGSMAAKAPCAGDACK